MGTEEAVYTPLQTLYWKTHSLHLPCLQGETRNSLLGGSLSVKLPSKAARGQLPSGTELRTEPACGVEFH